MRYTWIGSNGRRLEGELDAQQAVDMGASVTLEVLRRWYCTRGVEDHAGEHTDPDIAAMRAEGWTCELTDRDHARKLP